MRWHLDFRVRDRVAHRTQISNNQVLGATRFRFPDFGKPPAGM